MADSPTVVESRVHGVSGTSITDEPRRRNQLSAPLALHLPVLGFGPTRPLSR